MADTVQTIAADSTAASTSDTIETQVKTVLWYPFKVLKGFAPYMVYAGAPIELPDTDPQPANTTKWKPMDGSATHAAYWDTDIEAWRLEPNISKASLAQLKDAAASFAGVKLQVAEDDLNGAYPPTERNSWPQQFSEATLILGGSTGNSDAPLLTALAAARGVDLKTLAQSVVDKYNAYNTAYATMLADFQTARDKIYAAKKFADLPAIPFNFLKSLVF